MQGLLALQRYFEFSGRSARAEYWQFTGLFAVTFVVAYLLDLAFSGPYATPTFAIIVWLAALIPGIAVGVRRLHDRDRTGRWMVLSAGLGAVTFLLSLAAVQSRYTALGDVLTQASRVPGLANLALSIFLLVQFVKPGTKGPNQYGPDPLVDAAPAPTFADLASRAQSAAANAGINMPPPTRRPTEGDPLDQIERLAKLRDAGMLTDDEFAQQKAAYLSRL